MDLSQFTNRPLQSLAIPTSTLSVLLKAGYENPKVADLSIPLQSSQAIFSQRHTQSRAVPLTQSASTAASLSASRIPTKCTPLDALLGGGLPQRHVLELSGPPGTPKGAIAVGIVRSFLKENPDKEVIFLDTQNMTTASALKKVIPSDAAKRTFHHFLNTLPEMVVFLHTLPSILDERPKFGLLVLSSLHFPLQPSKKITPKMRTMVLENIKQSLLKLTARGVTVVVTSQLATKLLAADGSPATFDTGARAVMVPQLDPSYLPSALSFRVVICPNQKNSGVFRMLTEPGKGKQRTVVKEEPYTIPPRQIIPVLGVRG
ncbi:P-loop containing nucleoside triphosphate hydrolase protein [Roridomyces roridus]|uniref:P-loop containing nucleoside triphosphate hydrolase protein n=1 Tax=Roridomyces roridus TaxID=1738132 RepID=A0AAD7BYV2_9AGAR|nr:P-loop containing nucleoside triphosphate hydrolase protein [Roridomyces roridus]